MIRSIELKDILGTRRAEFALGTVTVVSGKNGEGKTSILQGVLRVFEGGHDPSILRRGAKFGEAVLNLDTGAVIRMRVTPKSTTYEVTDDQGNEIKAPRAYIQQLGDVLAVDPQRLLLAKPKELAAVLLEVMPITFGRDELQEALNENVWPVAGDMTLEQCEVIEKQVYEARATANRGLKDAETTAQQLRKSLPETDGYDWNERSKELRALLSEAKESREAAIGQIIRNERDTIDAIKQEAQRKVDEAKRIAGELRKAKDEEFAPTLEKISAAIGEAEEKARDCDRAEGLRQTIALQEKKIAESKRLADNFSDALQNVAELKARKLASLPIAGLEVREGQVLLDGVPFERVNLAERIKVVFQISALRAGKLPFLILDQAEAFDAETWEAFKEGAASSGFQVIAARVSDGPLAIEAAA